MNNNKVIAMKQKEANEDYRARYDEVIAQVQEDIDVANAFIEDLMNRYDPMGKNIEEIIKIQNAIVSLRSYTSQKRVNKVELENQRAEYCN